jgi:hypothetical protein
MSLVLNHLRVRIPLSLYSFLQTTARTTGRSVHQIVAQALMFYVRIRGTALDVAAHEDESGTPNMVTLDVTISPDVDRLIVYVIDDSFFTTPSAVVRSALVAYQQYYNSQGFSYMGGS